MMLGNGCAASDLGDTSTLPLQGLPPGDYVVEVDGNLRGYTLSIDALFEIADTRPLIEHLDSAPSVVWWPRAITLTAGGVIDPYGDVLQVEFYRDTNDNGEWDDGVDERLGAGQDGDAGWNLNVDTAAWELGKHTLFARPMNSSSAWGEPVPTAVFVTPIWHNWLNELDVNSDRWVSPIDALLVINYLNNEHQSDGLPDQPMDVPQFVDVNDDGSCTPIDALLVINFLNGGEGEGEQSADNAVPAATWWQAADTTAQKPVGADLSATVREGASRGHDSRPSSNVLQSLDLLFAKLDDSHRTRTGEATASRRDTTTGDLEEFLDGMLSGEADEEELLATAAR